MHDLFFFSKSFSVATASLSETHLSRQNLCLKPLGTMVASCYFYIAPFLPVPTASSKCEMRISSVNISVDRTSPFRISSFSPHTASEGDSHVLSHLLSCRTSVSDTIRLQMSDTTTSDSCAVSFPATPAKPRVVLERLPPLDRCCRVLDFEDDSAVDEWLLFGQLPSVGSR